MAQNRAIPNFPAPRGELSPTERLRAEGRTYDAIVSIYDRVTAL